MKIAAIAMASALTLTACMHASEAEAIELGGGLSAGAEIDMNYTTGIEQWALEATPEVGYSTFGLDLTVGSTFDLMGLNEDDVFKGLDFKAEYPVVGTGLTAYGEVGTDADFEFGDIKMGVNFAF